MSDGHAVVDLQHSPAPEPDDVVVVVVASSPPSEVVDAVTGQGSSYMSLRLKSPSDTQHA